MSLTQIRHLVFRKEYIDEIFGLVSHIFTYILKSNWRFLENCNLKIKVDFNIEAKALEMGIRRFIFYLMKLLQTTRGLTIESVKTYQIRLDFKRFEKSAFFITIIFIYRPNTSSQVLEMCFQG